MTMNFIVFKYVPIIKYRIYIKIKYNVYLYFVLVTGLQPQINTLNVVYHKHLYRNHYSACSTFAVRQNFWHPINSKWKCFGLANRLFIWSECSSELNQYLHRDIAIHCPMWLKINRTFYSIYQISYPESIFKLDHFGENKNKFLANSCLFWIRFSFQQLSMT